MRDTTQEAGRVQTDAIRRLAPIERLTEALALSESVRALALSRLRERYPDRTDLELVELLAGAPLRPAPPGSAG
jgi:hypothetical protein